MSKPTYTSGLLFTQAHKVVRAAIYTILERYQLSPSYWSILGATVLAPEGIRLTNVAKQMDVKAPLVTMLATNLIEMGLINRIEHHTDKRAKLLVITPKGKKIAQQIEAELGQKIDRLLQGASREEIGDFQKVLEIILVNASHSAA